VTPLPLDPPERRSALQLLAFLAPNLHRRLHRLEDRGGERPRHYHP